MHPKTKDWPSATRCGRCPAQLLPSTGRQDRHHWNPRQPGPSLLQLSTCVITFPMPPCSLVDEPCARRQRGHCPQCILSPPRSLRLVRRFGRISWIGQAGWCSRLSRLEMAPSAAHVTLSFIFHFVSAGDLRSRFPTQRSIDCQLRDRNPIYTTFSK